MTSISRSILLAAGLFALPLAGAVAQDTGKSTGPSSASTSDHKTAETSNGGAMKTTGAGYESKSQVEDGVGKSPGNAANGQPGKQPQ